MLVRARSVFIAPGVPVGLFFLFGFARRSLFGLCLLFFTEFGVAGFPAIGNLGQELTDVFDFSFSPKMNRHAAARCRFGGWNLASLYVTNQGDARKTELLSRLTG